MGEISLSCVGNHDRILFSYEIVWHAATQYDHDIYDLLHICSEFKITKNVVAFNIAKRY